MKKIIYPYSNRWLRLTTAFFIACASYCQAQYYNQNALTLPAQYIKNPYTANGASYTSVPGGYNFNAIIAGNMTVSSGETEGRLLVGQNFTVGTTTGAGCSDGGDYTYATSMNTSGLGQPAQSGNFHNIIVGNNFTIQNSTGPDMQQANWGLNGVAIYGGTMSPSPFATQNTNYQSTGVIPGPTAIKTYYQNLSTMYAGLATTGTVTYGASAPTVLDGGNASLTQYVFNVNYTSMDSFGGITLQNVNPNASILINITGAPTISVGSGGTDFTISGLTAVQTREHVLVNLPTATQLDFTSTQLDFSLLAPAANAKFQGGVLNGMVVIGGDMTACQGFEFHNPMSSVVISQPTVTISGNVFNDVNGLTDNTVNGTGTNAGGLNAILYDNTTGKVAASVPVAANGSYSFDATPGDAFTVYVTANTAAVGQTTVPVVALPTGWVNTGEHLGSAAGNDGTVDGVLLVGTVNTAVTDVNFGIEQLPTAGSGVNTASNTGGTTGVPVPPNTFTNTTISSDIAPGTVSRIRITGFPSNTTSLTINGTVYMPGSFPAGGVVVLTDGSGVPTVPILVDPTNDANPVSIPFKAIDNAGKESLNTGTAVLNFSAPMPVNLVSFQVRWVSGLGNQLDWVTSWEKNNDRFEVQSSTDARSFESIGQLAGKGTTQAQEMYTFVDTQPIAELTYYRLKQVDMDGRSTYSKIIGTRRGIVDQALTVYPNPTSDKLQLTLADQTVSEINLYSGAGQQVLHQLGSAASVDVQRLPSGSYLIEIKTVGGVVYRQRFIKH